MRTIILIISLFLSLTLAGTSWAQYAFPQTETYYQSTFGKKNGDLRSQLEGKFIQIEENRFALKEVGQGDYGKYKNVTWILESQTKLHDNHLYPVFSTLEIQDSDKNRLFYSKREYDYAQKTVTITSQKQGHKKPKQRVLSLKIPYTDDATVIYYLRPYLPALMRGETVRFHFVSSEPGAYTLKAEFVAEEKVSMNEKTIDAVKIALTPDVGILNAVVEKLVPPTLLWFSNDDAKAWLKYEGLEKGRRSEHIVTTVDKLIPAL